ncbi:DUF262 domain-containing protein [Paenibacillus terrae]|uniref:GmrSD restriction endonucleases N-terminal domain-containing protein n=1 Tax=Paenibacillus terrae TaxID=159743 RepID=A0A0D7WVT1_9BACL|nr:DUF262 domain-containing protein [Paenibacillus terrae]KJD43296.1 hypothetical protein QD47_23340 [Paenibacillus terrae]
MGKPTVQWTTYIINNMKDQFNFDLHFQRGYVRQKDRPWKSLLIHTFLNNGYVPNLLVWKNGDHLGESKPGKFKWIYYAVDCKQRLKSLYEYLEDKFRLSDDTPPVNGVNVAGKLYSELSEEMQQALKSFNFAVTIFDEEYTLEDVEEIFYRVNQTKPLTEYEQARALLGEENLSIVADITKEDFFSRINFTSADLTGNVNEKTVFQIISLIMEKNISFSGKDIKKFIADIGKKKIPDNIIAQIKNNCKYMEESVDEWTLKECKAGLKKSVIPSLFMASAHARKFNVEPKKFGDWAKKFLVEDYSKESPFGLTVQSRTSNILIVQKRTELMLNDLKNFMINVA